MRLSDKEDRIREVRASLKPEFRDFPQKHVLQSVHLAASNVLTLHSVTQCRKCWLTHCYTMSHVLTYTHCSTMLHVLAYTHLHTVVNTNHLLRHSSAIWSTHRHDHRRSGFHRHTPISCCASYSSAQFHNHFDIKLANTRCSLMQDRKIAPQAPSDK